MGYKHWNYNEFNTYKGDNSALSDYSLKAAQGAGLCIYVTDIVVNMGGTARLVTLLAGAGGAGILQLSPAANGSMNITFNVPMKVPANTALCCTTAGTSTGFFIAVNGYIGKN
jgi:hypothetical protein